MKELLIFAGDSLEAARSSSKLPREAVLHRSLSIGHGTGNRTVFRVKQAARDKESTERGREAGENSRTVVLQRRPSCCNYGIARAGFRSRRNARQRQRYEATAGIRHVARTKIERARARLLAFSNLSWGSLMELRESLRPGALTSALKLQPVPITRAVIRSAGRVASDSSGCCETTNQRFLPAKSCGTIGNPKVDVRICNSPLRRLMRRQTSRGLSTCRIEAAPLRTPLHAPRTRALAIRDNRY